MKNIKRVALISASISLILLGGCGETSKKISEKTAPVHKIVKEKQKVKPKVVAPVSYLEPILPIKNAKPLESYYDAEALSKMPLTEAHGDTRERSVPLGETLQKGKTDLTNGPFKKYRIVSYYGHPQSAQMGILGQYKPEEFMKKLIAQTKAYSDIDPKRPAIPAIELITTVAQRNAGPNGLYYHMTDKKDIETYLKLAKEHHALLILDVQLGQDSVIHQTKLLEEYLKLPYVTLAIDTEFHVKKGQTPGVQLGHVYGEDIQEAIDYVSDLTVKNHLPDKMVIVHQFAEDIIINKNSIHPTDHIEILLNNDGFGDASIKRAEYHSLVREEPIQYGGFKLFYSQDKPVMTPKEVLELDPAPAFVDYQ